MNMELKPALTAQIVSAYVAGNVVDKADLPGLITSVGKAIDGLDNPEPVVEERPEPAVPIKKSVQPDYIVCLEDGKKLKMMKRYLRTHYNMTPEEYRARWDLPSDYPMVAPNYSQKRTELAKEIGLGKKPAKK